jgi:hypothetical protein
VAIAKGAMFCLPQYIDSSAAIIFGELHAEDCLRGLRHDRFAGRLAHYLGEVTSSTSMVGMTAPLRAAAARASLAIG